MNVTKQLYQWDTGQKLTECTGIYVDFPIGEDIYRVETADGTCIIPDELLQKSSVHKIYECMADNTLREFVFNVKSRPKPPDYVYTPTERLTFEGLVQRVDDAVADMIRRAESGEFDGHTPVKGTDYFTTGEIQQIQNEVSSGAIGEFKSVVDTETETFNTNAESKLTTYNENDVAKTGAYNTNASNKVTEYNSNAENKTAEFDTHTEQIQADVNKLKSDLTGLQTVVDSKADKTELAKTNLYLDALFKLNRGQTWDTIESENESYSVDVPGGSKYVGIDKVGGKSIAWNQLIKQRESPLTRNGVTSTYNTDGTVTLSGTVTSSYAETYDRVNLVANHIYLFSNIILANPNNISFVVRPLNIPGRAVMKNTSNSSSTNCGISEVTSGTDLTGIKFKSNFFDLTQMFGSTIADYIYSLEQANAGAGVAWFKKLFPADYYPYSEPTIISSQTDRVDVARADSSITQQITTGFPVLNSAGSVYDYIDLNEGKLHRRVGIVDLGSLNWEYAGTTSATCYSVDARWFLGQKMLCVLYTNEMQVEKGIYAVDGVLRVIDSSYTDAATFKAAMSGVMLYYELAEEIVTAITIPTELSDWLTVEAGGSVTFHNADEGKRLLVPNKLSFVRKLDEVSV